MSAAHICIRSALIQAFRPSNRRVAASFSVPEFLVPALAAPSGRHFSSAKRRQQKPSQPCQAAIGRVEEPDRRKLLRDGTRSVQFRIRLPDSDARNDIQQWLAAIDPFLPPHLRKQKSDKPDLSSSVTPVDLAWVLTSAQDASQDILGHIGLVEERWDAVVWIAKKLTEDGRQSIDTHAQMEPYANVLWPETQSRSLDDLTGGPLLMQRARPSTKLQHRLDDLTSAPDSIDVYHGLVKRALGQLWRSLGSMIQVAAQGGDKEDDPIMARVLEIIAYMHHMGLMPDSVYTHRPSPDGYALQQPPSLHLLSSKILIALSDATWRAHEASVKVAKERMNASYFLGHEIPGSRFKVPVPKIAPDVWLELVLWTCLHGGWILDGTAILQELASRRGEHRWGAISWGELLQAKERYVSGSRSWGLFLRRERGTPTTGDAAPMQSTISSEVVTAFIDGLVNTMRLGVGARGTDPESVVGSIKTLKHFLDSNTLSLGSTSWDSIVTRLLESGGIVPEKRPELVLSILDLGSEFGTEVSTVNAFSQMATTETEPPYFFEPTTVTLSLLHRAMRSFVHNGDISGAITTLNTLQRYTDRNKQRSLEQFFETLKSAPVREDEPFTSRLPPLEFPAFDTQLPIPLLARLLDLATDSRMYDLGRSFLFSDDLDGPLIQPYMHPHWTMAASIVRFGTLAGENDLVLRIVKKTGTWSDKHLTQRMPAELLTALLCSQIQLHRWQSLRGMQDYVVETPGYRPRPEVLATFAAELLRLSERSGMVQDAPRNIEARNAFKGLLFAWENLILTNVRNQLYCILAMLSTVHEEWKEYCSQFLSFSTLQGIQLSTDDFNQVLSGVLDGYGSLKGRDFVENWCYKPPKTFEPYRAAGGLPTMPQFRIGKGEEYESRPENIEIVQSSGAKLILKGRVYPNRQTMFVILRKVQQEEDQRRAQGKQLTLSKRHEVRETLKWAARILYYLGFDYEDIIRDLGSLADLAELEAPRGARIVGLEDEQGS